MLNSTWLHTFKTLVEVGHFTKTAELLFMTQPGVSQHIKKLEQACEHPLLIRNNKRFELTEQGQIIYRYALQQEKQEQQLKEQLNFDAPFTGSCKLACSGANALKLYPALLALQKRYPELVIHLEASPNATIFKQLSSRETDLAVVTQQPDQHYFDYRSIGEESLCLLLPSSWNSELPIEQQLEQLGLVQHPDANHYLNRYLSACGEPSLATKRSGDFPVSGYVNQLSQILLPVAEGLGFTVLPETALSGFAGHQQLRIYSAPKTVSEERYLVNKGRRLLPMRFEVIKQCIETTLSF